MVATVILGLIAGWAVVALVVGALMARIIRRAEREERIVREPALNRVAHFAETAATADR
ncbi:hypothetical protein [Microbacterium sp. No. 7]|uniref:hypothetical protein n=1 Tax=Microbacterium sp. No. 7 TaxID=1714373 RepID=UPI0006ED3B02|nr:hypothetical protein [Microbacterium sp. No. 7]ALJ19089.1 hypothetical protein AOA12_03885 [Microbacterium sp. No. 7]